jgi:phosphoadenosine phosphosulfate reductase
MENAIATLSSWIDKTDVAKTLQNLAGKFPGEVTLSSSLGQEDQIISHIILSNRLNVKIFTLDTGRMFPETYSVWSRTNERYNTTIEAYYPTASKIEKYVTEKGPNAFYDSVENRKECCFIRKVEPLQRALKNKKIWVTGLRAEHSPARKDLQLLEWDEANQIIKYNPLLHWTTEEVNAFIKKHNIPYNSLFDKGFLSIGCAPCTRVVQAGEDMRSGRWWWEDTSKKECGLHAR